MAFDGLRGFPGDLEVEGALELDLDPGLRSADGSLFDDPGGEGDAEGRIYGLIAVVGVSGDLVARGMMNGLVVSDQRWNGWYLVVKLEGVSTM